MIINDNGAFYQNGLPLFRSHSSSRLRPVQLKCQSRSAMPVSFGDLQLASSRSQSLTAVPPLLAEEEPLGSRARSRNDLANAVRADLATMLSSGGEGQYMALQFHPIGHAFSMSWDYLADATPVAALEMLARWQVAEGPYANKFIGPAYACLSPSEKIEFCRTNILFRGTCVHLPSVGVNVLADYWEIVLDDETRMQEMLESFGKQDLIEIQEFSSEVSQPLAAHTMKAISGMRAYCEMSGNLLTVDDWIPAAGFLYCNNTDFILQNLDIIATIKIDIKACLALFGIRLLENESPNYRYSNKGRWTRR